MAAPLPSFDIFCRVIDNFGDIGVCWRLARQLAQAGAGPMRLWVDDLRSFARIEGQVSPGVAEQTVEGIDIVHWTAHAPSPQPHEVVVEAFACDPPPGFVARMRQRRSLWINLEYLSAEDWVQDCHALPSPQAGGLTKFFFFPGFTEATGGLLREAGLLDRQRAWQARPALRRRLLDGIGMPDALADKLMDGWRQVFVFCYGHAPADALAHALDDRDAPSVIIVPQGVLPALRTLQTDTLRVFESPFVSQDDFDKLLWSSDLNIVRGEDSLLRATWAGRPFIWHIYPQEEQAHLVKLDAWLARAGWREPVPALMRAWNAESAQAGPSLPAGLPPPGGPGPVLDRLLSTALSPPHWEQWRADALSLRDRLATQDSLVQRLLAFCAEHGRKG